jgi:hypothetical protein
VKLKIHSLGGAKPLTSARKRTFRNSRHRISDGRIASVVNARQLSIVTAFNFVILRKAPFLFRGNLPMCFGYRVCAVSVRDEASRKPQNQRQRDCTSFLARKE